MKYLLAVLSLALVATVVSADSIREIQVLTSSCTDCGMTSLGKLSVKVCGKREPTALGGLCCIAINLDNNQDNFEEGAMDIFAGPSSLGECYNFDLGTLTNPGDVGVTLYHSGSDGGKFEWVQVLTNENKRYRCQVGVFMDGSNYFDATGCTLQN